MATQFVSVAKEFGNKYAGIFYKNTKKGTTYYVQFRNENGKPDRKKVNANNKTEALEALDAIKKKIKAIKSSDDEEVVNKIVEKKNADKFITLNEMAEYYFEHNEFKTKQDMKGRYELHISDHDIGKKIAKLITIVDLKNWRKVMEKKRPKSVNSPTSKRVLTPKSINEVSSLASRIMDFAIDDYKYDGENIFKKLKRLKVDNVRLKLMTDEEIEEFWDTIVKKGRLSRGHTEYALLYAMLAITTGAREQSILQLKPEHIKLKEGHIEMYNTKTEQEYKAPIVEFVKPLLEKYSKSGNSYIFWNDKTHHHYTKAPRAVREALNTVMNNNIKDQKKKITVRDLRNVFATRLINKGENLQYIQKLLDHKTPMMTQRYAQLLDKAGHQEVKDSFASMSVPKEG